MRYLISPLVLTLLCSACSIIPASSATALRVNAREMLDAHNQTRAAVGLPGLRWSSGLAQYSQEWANYLAIRNRCQMKHRAHAGMAREQYGENLFWASPLSWSDGHVEVQAITARRVSDDWASEQPFYDYNSNRCQPGEQCGHYTQMVWRSTREVGCAATLCPNKGQIWVCNYDPPGNWVGERPY